ncbi:MAG: hypothetical protein F6K62_09790 [Sphaerospermopsis sp. SIO1G2]|nr:hypothetical protein [Sphaerospermopsis sp. SIO1G2]
MTNSTTLPNKKQKSNYSIADTRDIIGRLYENLPNQNMTLTNELTQAITDAMLARRGTRRYQQQFSGVEGLLVQGWNYVGPAFHGLGDYAMGGFNVLADLFSGQGFNGEKFFDTRARLSTNRQMKMVLDNVAMLTPEELGFTGSPEEFRVYKENIMLAVAEELGEQARRNGFPDTPDGHALLAGYRQNSPIALTPPAHESSTASNGAAQTTTNASTNNSASPYRQQTTAPLLLRTTPLELPPEMRRNIAGSAHDVPLNLPTTPLKLPPEMRQNALEARHT